MTRLRKLGLLLVVSALLFTLGLAQLPAFSRALLARGLSSFFGRDTYVGEVRFHLLFAEILDVRVAGPRGQGPPFLEVARVLATPSLMQLWARRLTLSELRLEQPRLRINAFAEGGDDIPRFGPRPRQGTEVRVGRLVIRGGEMLVDHARVPAEADLTDFQGRLDAGGDGALAGRVSFGPGSLGFGTAPPLEIGGELALTLRGSKIMIESGHLRTPRMDLEVAGDFSLGTPVRGELRLRGPVDLAILDRHLARTGLDLGGRAHFGGALLVLGSAVSISGHVEGRDGMFAAQRVAVYAGELHWDGDGLHVSRLEVEACGGAATLEIVVPAGASISRPVELKGALRGMDAESVLRTVFPWGPLELAAAATGDLALEWPRGRPRELSGRMDFELSARNDPRTPLAGHLEWTAEAGLQQLGTLDLKTPTAHARLSGRIGRLGEADLRVDAEATELESADAILQRLRRAVGNPGAERFGLAGTGTFRGSWLGSLEAPAFDGRFQGHAIAYRGLDWGEVAAVVRTSGDAFEARSLVARRGASELWLDGRFETGFFGEADAMDGRVRLTEWSAADIVKALGWGLALTGRLTGEATLQGRRSDPSGEARIQSSEGRFLGLDFREGALAARWGGHLVKVSSGHARLGEGTLSFRGSLSDDGIYDGELGFSGVDLSAFASQGPLELGGRISGELVLQGPLSRPRLRGRLASPHVFVGDEGMGALAASLRGDGDGQLALSATCRSGRLDLALEGALLATPPYAGAFTLKARSTSLDPFLRAVLPDLPASLGLVASGELRVKGPLATPGDLGLEATLEQLEVLLSEYPVHAREPVRLHLQAGRLDIEDFHLGGEGTDLVLAGGAALSDQGPLSFSVNGAADLRFLSVLSRQLRGSGAARLAMGVSGTRSEPKIEGALILDGAGLRLRGFPHGLESMSGTVRFGERGAQIEDLKATLAGGALALTGQLRYAGGRLLSFDLRPRGENMAFRYPEGLRSLVDADLRFFGDASRRFLTGSVEVREATYRKRYDVASELLAARGPALEFPALGEDVEFDIKLKVPGTFHVDNNLATLAARADLELRGTSRAPVVVGRADVDRGRLYFQGRTYLIRHGTLDFVNPAKLDPLFDIEAETRVRSYRITLRVNGTLERVIPTLSSDPPLSALQILNLLAGADEAAVATMTSAQGNEAQLAASGAASLAAGKIAEEVGIERGAGRLLGLDRFSIDPSILRGNGSTPTARVTVGKRITPDLNVLYSQDLTGTSERLLSVEYILSDRLSLILTRSDPDGFGFDVRLRRLRF